MNSVGDLCLGCDFIRPFGCCFPTHFHGVVILKGVETDGNRIIVVTIILTLPGWNRTQLVRIPPVDLVRIITEVNCFPIKQMCHWSTQAKCC